MKSLKSFMNIGNSSKNHELKRSNELIRTSYFWNKYLGYALFLILSALILNIIGISEVFAAEDTTNFEKVGCRIIIGVMKISSIISGAFIIAIGFSAATGRIEVKTAIIVASGVVVILGAPDIIKYISGEKMTIQKSCENKIGEPAS